MQALVTGATGLIGNHVVKSLISKGHKVKSLVRSTSNIQFLPEAGELTYGDILEAESLQNAAKDCDIIFHTAGTFAYWGYDNQKFMEEATKGMENVILAAAANKIQKIIFTSSSVTIGASDKPQELSESLPGNFDDAPGYVLAKVRQEETAFSLSKKTRSGSDCDMSYAYCWRA